MDQPFESDVIKDLAVENPLSSVEEFDEFEGREEENFDNEDISSEMHGFEDSEGSEEGSFLENPTK